MNGSEASPGTGASISIYEYEACPFCRRVRLALGDLDLVALMLPCPKGGRRFRPEVVRRGGREYFPYMIDADAGVEMYEARRIVDYLRGKRDESAPATGSAPWSSRALAGLEFAARRVMGAGLRARTSAGAVTPVELFGREDDSACARVRELLSELEIPWLHRSARTDSSAWRALVEGPGSVAAPVLLDPSTSEKRVGSADIAAYLETTYGG